MLPRRIPALVRGLLLAAPLTASAAAAAVAADTYIANRLVSDGFVTARHTDPHLVNPWGLALNPFGFAWVSDNGKDVATLYDGNGAVQSLVVAIPGGKPTGLTFNGSPTDFSVSGKPSPFIFATEAGIIAAWAPAIDPNNAQQVFQSPKGAIFKGVAIAGTGEGLHLYATDFHNNEVLVLNSQFQPAAHVQPFTDHSLPAGYAPFGIQNIAGDLYVTFAKQDADKEDDVAGPGNGFVDVFSGKGVLIRRFASRGPLNAPWGITLAPAGFGSAGGRLLIGNFGNGRINSFDLATGSFKGALVGPSGDPLEIEGLWGLAFGNGVEHQPPNVLFFTAGPDDEAHGLYGRIFRSPGGGSPAAAGATADAQ
jgi:uncharacterized protein (TIGR03118 family)